MKKKKERKKEKLLMVAAGFEPGIYGLRNLRLTTELPKPTTTYVTKYIFYIQYGVSDHTTFDIYNPTIPILIKKNLIKCIIKVVNVPKSQYYEFRHNIMNLGNQNSKYSWRIRDLENPRTGTQFANSVLMYKMIHFLEDDIIHVIIMWRKILLVHHMHDETLRCIEFHYARFLPNYKYTCGFVLACMQTEEFEKHASTKIIVVTGLTTELHAGRQRVHFSILQPFLLTTYDNNRRLEDIVSDK